MANLGKSFFGLFSVAAASALGAYGTARSSFQPQPPIPDTAKLVCWVLNFNDPLALALVALASITSGLSIYQAITALTKKEVNEIVELDGELTRERIALCQDEILDALSNRNVPPKIAIDTINNALKDGALLPDEISKLRKVIIQATFANLNLPEQILKEFESEIRKEGQHDIIMDSLRDFGGEPRSKIISERVKAIEAGESDLVEKYKSLAAFTAIEEPTRAIGFYKKALELAPSNVEALKALGQLLLHYGSTSEARSCFETALSSATESYERVDVAFGLSAALLKEGSIQAAKSTLLDALATSEGQILSNPSDAFWLHKVISLNLELASIDSSQGLSHSASQFLEDCFNLLEQLTAIGHFCETGEQSRSAAHDGRGRIELNNGETDAALEDFKHAVDIRRTLLAKNPSDSGNKRGLAVSLLQSAIVHVARGEEDEADLNLTEAHKITCQLVDNHPNNRIYTRDRYIITMQQADLRINQSNFEDAYDILEEEELGFQEIISNDDNDTQAKRDLSVVLERQGDIQKLRDKKVNALIKYQKSLSIRESIFKKYEENSVLQRDIAVISAKIGAIAINLNDHQNANLFLKKAQDIYLSRRLKNPHGREENFNVFDITQLIGDALWNARLRQDALVVYMDAQTQIDALKNQYPDILAYADWSRAISDRIDRRRAMIAQT